VGGPGEGRGAIRGQVREYTNEGERGRQGIIQLREGEGRRGIIEMRERGAGEV